MAIGLVLFVCFYDSRMTSQSFEAAVTKLGTLVCGCNFGSRRSKVEVAGVKKTRGRRKRCLSAVSDYDLFTNRNRGGGVHR